MKTKYLNLINKLWVVFLLGLMIYKLITVGSINSLPKNLILLSIIPISFGPFLINKILKYKLSEVLTFCYFLFICVALVLGSILGFYQFIDWFDLFAHLLSGIVSCVVALIFVKKFNFLKKENTVFIILFIIGFSLAIASFWEFFEFASDKIFKTDTQWVFETGVNDTMTDMLIAFAGTIIFSIYYCIMMKIKPKKFINFLDHVL